jgi:hypothetical protein
MMQTAQERVGLEGTGYDPDDLDDLVAAERMAVAAGDRREAQGGIVKHKDLIVMLPVDRFDVMAEQLRSLMNVWGMTTVAEAVERAVAAAYDLQQQLS